MGQSLSEIFQQPGEKETAEFLGQMFTYLTKNPQDYSAVRQFLIESGQIKPDELPEQTTPERIAQAAQFLTTMSGESQGLGDKLASMGRNGDTEIAHVNPQEAELLKAVGGSGSINPATGKREFFKIGGISINAGTVLGATAGFLVGGPVGAAYGAGVGASVDTMHADNKAALDAAAQQQQLAQEAENKRIADAEAAAQKAREAEARRQEAITAGANDISNIFGQFDDNFYNKRSQNYIDYATPELDRQYQAQQKSLISQLARTGNLNSSLRGDMLSDLQRQYDSQKMDIASKARNYSQDAKASVEAQRAALLESNSQLADAGLVNSKAQAAASSLTVDPQYSSLGTLISNLSSGISSNKTTAAGTTAGGVSLYNNGSNGSSKIVA
jgi:hypothetical protein